MRLRAGLQLCYCTNIHPGGNLDEVLANIESHAPRLKRSLSPGAPFGLGLRLSDRDSRDLLDGGRLGELTSLLEANELYVALINGFVFGSFHGGTVKEAVFAPDWRDRQRLDYTLRLIEILWRLLPVRGEGGISTAPLSYKPWVAQSDSTAWETMVRHLVRAVEALVRVRREHGRTIHLDIEPEPDGLVENSAELAGFFRRWLLRVGAPMLASRLGIRVGDARDELLEHVRVCFDTCHFACQYEEPEEALRRLAGAGIRVGRVQVSSALRVQWPAGRERRAQLAARLAAFADSTWLHQVVARNRMGALRRYPDLPAALAALNDGVDHTEWRVHFHVPLFASEYGPLGSTLEEIRKVFRLLERERFTGHLEIETYTWSVLPPEFRADPGDSIEREYRWVMAEVCERPRSLTLSA